MSHNHSIEEPVSVAVITTSTPVSITTIATISESIPMISAVSTVVTTATSASIVAAPVRKKKEETTKVCTHFNILIKPNNLLSIKYACLI